MSCVELSCTDTEIIRTVYKVVQSSDLCHIMHDLIEIEDVCPRISSAERIDLKLTVLLYTSAYTEQHRRTTVTRSSRRISARDVAFVRNRHHHWSSAVYATVNHRRQSFPVAVAHVWNGLPRHVTSAPSLSTFRSRLKTHLFQLSSDFVIFGHVNRWCYLSVNQSINKFIAGKATRPINTQTHKPIGRQTHTYRNREDRFLEIYHERQLLHPIITTALRFCRVQHPPRCPVFNFLASLIFTYACSRVTLNIHVEQQQQRNTLAIFVGEIRYPVKSSKKRKKVQARQQNRRPSTYIGRHKNSWITPPPKKKLIIGYLPL